jgi:hypothetical protein
MSLNFDLRIPPGKRGEGRNTMGSERGKWEKPEESDEVGRDGGARLRRWPAGSRKLTPQNESPGR